MKSSHMVFSPDAFGWARVTQRDRTRSCLDIIRLQACSEIRCCANIATCPFRNDAALRDLNGKGMKRCSFVLPIYQGGSELPGTRSPPVYSEYPRSEEHT